MSAVVQIGERPAAGRHHAAAGAPGGPNAQSPVWLRNGAGMSIRELRLERDGQPLYRLIALDAGGRLQGRAEYSQIEAGCAVLGLEVADALDDQGLGTLLVRRLAQHAETHGIDRFSAPVLPENRALLEVLGDGIASHVTWSGRVNSVEFPTSAWRRLDAPAAAPRRSLGARSNASRARRRQALSRATGPRG